MKWKSKVVGLICSYLLFSNCFLELDFAWAGSSSGGTTFTFRIRDEPETLDWNRAHTVVESYFMTNLMEGLVSFGSGLSVFPALAEGWNLSRDGKTYTFRLRPGVKWSDGVPLVAEDFVMSWKRLLSPITAASYAYILFDIEGAEEYNRGKIQEFEKVGVKALNSFTLQVTLKRPVLNWIYIPAFWATFPVRQDIIEKFGSGWETPGRMVNLGPYSLETHDWNSKIVLKANPYYYGERGNVDRIVALIVQDDVTALGLYKKGKLDFLNDIATVEIGRSLPDLKRFPYLKTGFLGFVTEKYPISNLKLRRAIAMALDKSRLKQILYGSQEPATSLVPPQLVGYTKNIGLPYNPKKARSELASSGINITQAFTIDYALPNWDKSIKIAHFVQDELKRNLGLNVTLHPMNNVAYRTQLDLFSSPLFDNSWTADYPDADSFISLFKSASGNSQTTWKNANFDQLADIAHGTILPGEKEKRYIRLQKILLEEEVVIVPLYYEPNLVLIKPKVRNFEINPLDYLFLRKLKILH